MRCHVVTSPLLATRKQQRLMQKNEYKDYFKVKNKR